MRSMFFDKYGYLHRRWAYSLLAVGFALFIWLINVGMAYSCSQRAEIYQLEHHYSSVTGCNVLVDGQYRSIDNVRVVIDQ